MNRRSLKILIHLLCWLSFIFLLAAFLHNGNDETSTMAQIILSGPFCWFAAFYILIFYLNLYVLMPVLFLKKKYIAFTIASLMFFLAAVHFQPFEHTMRAVRDNSGAPFRPPPGRGPERRFAPPPGAENRQPGQNPGPPATPGRQQIDIISLILFFMTSAVSSMLVLSGEWRQAERNKAIIEAEKANAELAFLKAQISPHFLFNVLNNIYALAITQNGQTASSILRLSNIMRYVTDEARTNFVPIEKEIACINDYIALQKLRLSDKVTVHYTVNGLYDNTLIAPLILIAFVENCFKHGISNNTASDITVRIEVNEKYIKLETANPVRRSAGNTEREGIGLQNVTQRLKHLYGNHYHLDITGDDSVFRVILLIKKSTGNH